MKFITRIVPIILLAALISGCGTVPGSDPVMTGPKLEQRARDFVTRMEAGEYKEARQYFDTAMRLTLSQKKLEELWGTLQEQTGTFEKQGNTRLETEQNYQIVYVTCRFGLGALDVKVVFNQKGQISGLFFQPAADTTALAPEYVTPAYADVNAFHEEEVFVESGEWQLPGTLTLPTGSGPFPAVVLVHGSGPNDRDETIGPNRVFKDLAWGLATRGVAVLRYEKRTREYAERFTGDLMSGLTTQGEVIDDALAAVSLLQARPEINSERVFIVGHSLGATLAPKIAEQDAQIAGLVLLAGTTRPIEDLILEQSTYLANADGEIDKDEANQLAGLEALVEQVKALPGQTDVDPNGLILGAAPAYWLDLIAYNPVATAEKLTQPMLILQGERDYQVTMTDFAAWEEAFGSRANVILKSYPALNHLFIAGQGSSLPTEYEVMGHLDAEVIDDVANWIQQ
ncbi:MAG: alpha/beta fold hydrolase [Bellilinea sp.]